MENFETRKNILGTTLPKTLGKKFVRKTLDMKTWIINLGEKSLHEYFKQTSRENFYRIFMEKLPI